MSTSESITSPSILMSTQVVVNSRINYSNDTSSMPSTADILSPPRPQALSQRAGGAKKPTNDCKKLISVISMTVSIGLQIVQPDV